MSESAFHDMDELLQDFLTEASELLSEVENQLVALEKHPGDRALLNDIFRGFHTIKGGAGFVNVTELVTLCHLAESLLDRLRNGDMVVDAAIMDVILEAAAAVREMFADLSRGARPAAVEAAIVARLESALHGPANAHVSRPAPPAPRSGRSFAPNEKDLDWAALYEAVAGAAPQGQSDPAPLAAAAATDRRDALHGRRAGDDPDVEAMRAGRRETDRVVAPVESTIRVDTTRLDQVLNLSGEIGLAKNRLNCLRTDLVQGKIDADTVRQLDKAVSHLDLLVGDLQNAVMKTRMQPVGRLFQRYPRVARDLARQLGKRVELEISGEDTELDKTMIEDLSDPLIHLLRNAVDHGIETLEERRSQGKPDTALLRLSAEQVGDQIVIQISDDGRGIRPDVLRRKAVQKHLIDADSAANMADQEALKLIFLPGFSTKETISDLSGRGVGMDVVKTNIQKLNGRIEIDSVVGQGSRFTIHLPLTVAILPVLVIQLGEQPFAVPLSLVREIVPIRSEEVQEVSGRATMMIRDKMLPVRSLACMLGWPLLKPPAYGVLMQSALCAFVLAVDGFVGRDDVVIKPLEDIKPKGVAGATLSGDGSVVLVLDLEQLLTEPLRETREDLFRLAA
ncbi:MAG TPA: chemotaxis protein CheA [Burkholderiales bacterium]|nr:chemotaxis protein CheA [Burkholderiales bacterium]